MLDFNKLDQPYLIAEIGINHNGSLELAKRLIDASFATSWDCVKFQKRNPDVAVPEHQKDVERETPWGTMTYLEYKWKIEFQENEYRYIDSYCREKPIDWSVSVWDLDSLSFMDPYEIPFLKLPSAMLTNEELMTACARTKTPLIVSTGMSTLDEVDAAVELLRKEDANFALLHSNSSYPANPDDLNLNAIPFMKDRYGCVVGYSGHEYGLTPTVIAYAMGAMIIERHVTLDREMWGTDQSSSVEIQGMYSLKSRLKEVERSLGKAEKIVTESEIAVRKKLRGD